MRWASPPLSVSALRLSCEIAEADLVHEAQALHDLHHDVARDLALGAPVNFSFAGRPARRATGSDLIDDARPFARTDARWD